MENITVPKKLAYDLYAYLGSRPAKEVNLMFNQLAIAIDTAQKGEKNVPTKGEEKTCP